MEYENAVVISTIMVAAIAVYCLCITMNPLATSFITIAGIIGLISILGLAKVLQIICDRLGL